MKIGIPIECKTDETRVALLPDAVSTLTEQGHQVFVPEKLGESIGLIDDDYKQSGGIVLANNADVYAEADLIVKVKEPVEDDLSHLKAHHTLFCYLHLASNPNLIHQLCNIGCISIAFEMVTVDHKLPLLIPMSKIAGYLAADIGMQYLRFPDGKQGVITGFDEAPVRFAVIGGGQVGMSAAKRIQAIGGQCTVYESNQQVISRLRKKWGKLINFQPISPQLNLTLRTGNFDCIIGASLQPGLETPNALRENDLPYLKKHSTLIDVSIDQGGCFETSQPTTHREPVFKKHDIIHYAVTNMPSAAPKTATTLLSQALLPWVKQLGSNQMDQALSKAVMTNSGRLVFTALNHLYQSG